MPERRWLVALLAAALLAAAAPATAQPCEGLADYADVVGPEPTPSGVPEKITSPGASSK